MEELYGQGEDSKEGGITSKETLTLLLSHYDRVCDWLATKDKNDCEYSLFFAPLSAEDIVEFTRRATIVKDKLSRKIQILMDKIAENPKFANQIETEIFAYTTH